MITADDAARLVAEVGETDDGRIQANVVAVWQVWQDRDTILPGLTRLYVKRQLIELAIGAVRAQVDFQAAGDVGMKSSQRATALQAMYDQTLAEIIRLERKARGKRPGASMALTTITPASPPWPTPPYADANDARLRGDPYRRPLYGRDSGLP